VLDLQTGKVTSPIKVAGDVTVNYDKGGSESESIRPVGFSSDCKQIYVIRQASSLFVGGNKLLRVSVAGGTPETIDVGVADTAVNASGDLVILKPGSVQYVPKSGNDWTIDPDYRSIYINGVGFTDDGKPFYYTSDNVVIVGPKGTVQKLDAERDMDAKPVVSGSALIWDDGKQIVTNKGGKVSQISKLGSNRQPFN
jgi:hypothetical protein